MASAAADAARIAGLLPAHRDILIVVPPFTRIRTPPVAPHLLAAIAARMGRQCGVLYANALFAHHIGGTQYGTITSMATRTLLGERVFAAAAYGVPALGWSTEAGRVWFERRREGLGHGEDLTWSAYAAIERRAEPWVAMLAQVIAEHGFGVVGCSAQFEQTSASVALLQRVKAARPQTVTLLGGANCEGPMADGIAALDRGVDYVFSGESDATFPAFLEAIERGDPPTGRVIRGMPTLDLDALPTPSFVDYYAQIDDLFPRAEHGEALWRRMWIPLESSRGCWWGQKHHCTFCGLNGNGMGFREKSPDRVIADLDRLVAEHPCGAPRVQMTDNIMPYSYFKTVIPRLAGAPTGAELFYEQKANLSLAQVAALKAAGVDTIQPGIESLSTPYLRRMDKGTTAAQNIALLRYARAVGLGITWNMLSDFPGDERAELEAMAALLPLLRHLAPPTELSRLSIDRFSPYFDRPAHYGIASVTPIPQYAEILPRESDPARIGYFFAAEYDSATRQSPDLIASMREEIASWRDAWARDGHAAPMLRVHPSPSGREFVLIDTRGLPGTQRMQVIDRARATAALVGDRAEAPEALAWAIEHRVCAPIEGRAVPLAVADVAVLEVFEGEMRTATARPSPR